jgi:hypothetical protein
MTTIKLELEVEETNLILEALGNLPFVQVFQLIGRIQAQAQAQVQPQMRMQAVPAGPAAQAQPGADEAAA